MMPHEETWEAWGSDVHVVGGTAMNMQIDDVGRALLAAQAPAMARLLIPLARRSYCGWCRRPRACGHRPTCKIANVLSAAGVPL
jgi:hypothetical protein